jgi:small subunit ribosomal protein S11
MRVQMFYGLPYEDIPICHIKASKNNTLISFTTPMGEAITSTSCRREGFKNARKKTEVAAQTTGLAAGVRALRRGLMTVRVRLQGIGPGRVAAPKGLALSGINIVSITDCTLATEIGPRPKNVRRV